jgi:tetratricopeptide (TPR) repeat protein
MREEIEPDHQSQSFALKDTSEWISKADVVWEKESGKSERIALLRLQAQVAHHRKYYLQADGLLKKCLTLELDLGRELAAASTLEQLGNIAAERKKFKSAHRHLSRALELAQKHKDLESQAYYSANLGEIAAQQGNFDQSLEYLKRGLEISRDIGLANLSADIQYRLARILNEQNQHETALSYACEALTTYHQSKHFALEELEAFVADLRKNHKQS